MSWRVRISSKGFGFRKDEEGACLVEFGIVFPVMLLLLVMMVEAGRLLWSYQIVVEGVREAGRYMSRTAPVEICETGGSVAGMSGTLQSIVTQKASTAGQLDQYVTVNSVTASHTCVVGAYKISPTPVGTVTANITINFPFTGIMGYFGQSMTSSTAVVRDQSRIFGS